MGVTEVRLEQRLDGMGRLLGIAWEGYQVSGNSTVTIFHIFVAIFHLKDLYGMLSLKMSNLRLPTGSRKNVI